MPGPNFILDKGFLVAGAVTLFRAVELTSTKETVQQCNAANDVAIGIAQEQATAQDATDGRSIGVRIMGISRAIAAGSISIGDRVKVQGSGGKLTPLAGTAGLVENVVGIALTAAAADGDHFDVLLTPGTTVNTAVS